MDWLANILNNENSWKSFIFFFITLITIVVLVKKGIISFKGKGLTVGNSNERDIERNIIRSQIQYVKATVSDFYDNIPNFEGRDEWRLRFVCEKIISIFTDTISLNHISKEPIYTEMKQAAVWAAIVNNTKEDIMTSDDFKKVVYAKTAEILEKLISIREYYSLEKK